MTDSVMCFRSGEEVAVTSHRDLDLTWALGTVTGKTLFLSIIAYGEINRGV